MNAHRLGRNALITLGLALSLAGSVAGCGSLAGSGLGLAGRQTAEYGTLLAKDGLAAAEADSELDRSVAATGKSNFRTMSHPSKLEDRDDGDRDDGDRDVVHKGKTCGCHDGQEAKFERLRDKDKDRIEELKKIIDIKTPVVTTDASGSVTVTVDITIKRRNGTTHEVISRTWESSGHEVHVTYDADRTFKNGRTVKIHRERTIHPDGTWDGTFNLTVTRPDGKTKTVKWTSHGAADGSETSTGTIARFDGSVVTISITHETSGRVTVVIHDDQAQIDVACEEHDGDHSADVTVITHADGKVVDKVTVTDTTDMEMADL